MSRLKILLFVLAIMAGSTFFRLQPAARQAASSIPAVEHSQSWGARIAAGHAFTKHSEDFGGATRAELAAFIDRVIAQPTASRRLSRGREAYWDGETGTVIICDPNSADGGTVFKPDRGRKYFEGLR